jgi:hypothetical protein
MWFFNWLFGTPAARVKQDFTKAPSKGDRETLRNEAYAKLLETESKYVKPAELSPEETKFRFEASLKIKQELGDLMNKYGVETWIVGFSMKNEDGVFDASTCVKGSQIVIPQLVACVCHDFNAQLDRQKKIQEANANEPSTKS